MRFRLQFCYAVAAAFVFGLAAQVLSAQIIWEQDYRGRKIWCGVSGLSGFGDSCGYQSYYAAFIGKIVSIQELPEDEFRIVASPTEVFKGNLPATVTITTRSGACMAEFKVGEERLFALQRDEKSGDLLFWFGGPDAPIAENKQTIERFRQLAQMKDTGIIMGEVSNDSGLFGKPRAHHKVIVRSIPSGPEYAAITNNDGDFEFPPLPVGKYEIDANTARARWTGDGGKTTVEAHQCRDYHIMMHVDGSISGAVFVPNVDKAHTWNVSAVPLDAPDTSAADAYTNDTGHFEIRGLKPGRYRVGIEIVGVSSSYNLKFGVYAPGVRDQIAAEVIDLGKNEKRSGIDIRIPEDALQANGPRPQTSK